MRFVFLGAEVPSHRILLLSSNVTAVGINYWRLVKRGIPKKGYLLEEKFPDDVSVYLHSGTPKDLGPAEVEEFAADYQDFVVANIDRLAGFTEFDAWDLPHVRQQRVFWDEVDDQKFWPVWHHEHGLQELEVLARGYPHVAISGDSLDAETTLAGKTNALTNLYGTTFHALGVAKPDDLRSVRAATAHTQAWLAPMLRGETIIWDGSRLRRYPKRMKDQARSRYSAIITQAGLDWEKVREDDNNEVARLAVWSLLRLEENMARRKNPFTVIEGGKQRPEVPDNSEYMDDPGDAETGYPVSDNKGLDVRNSSDALARPVVAPRSPEEMMTLPGVGFTQKDVLEPDEDGNLVRKTVPVLSAGSASVRMCDTCFVAANCPAMKPNSTCAFNLPVEIRTQEQLKALLTSIIEIQGQRVLFGRYTEDLNGGYPDPNVSQEIDRLFKLTKLVKELEDNKEFARITVERRGTGGMLSSIFGERAQVLNELPSGGLDEDAVNRILDQ